MTAIALNPLRAQKTTSEGLQGVAQPSSLTAKGIPQQDKRLEEASRQFEAVFLRQILSGLGRAVGGTSGQASGGIYGSMFVDAISDAISRAGGIGIGSMLTKSLQSTNGGAQLKVADAKSLSQLVEPLGRSTTEQGSPANSATRLRSTSSSLRGRSP